MKVNVPAGKYVVAVSGGVDSVALLHVLAHEPDLQLVVAHYDHGIRPDSAEDRKLVQLYAKTYGLPFEYEEGKLGQSASEATARKARYDFLRRVCKKHSASAIITAHHQDDVLETIIINFLRGTKSRGLSSLRSTIELVRPLLHVPKETIRMYALESMLEWREDSTNSDQKFLRNYVRLNIVPRMDSEAREALLATSKRASELNDAIQTLVDEYLQAQSSPNVLNRAQFTALPAEVASEVLVQWLRTRTAVTISKQLVARLYEAILNGRNGSQVDVAKGWSLGIRKTEIKLFR
ncbi:MAG: tRNA lysidine(34) synthetase TilS [Candidatus Saccharimonadales bacterium]